MKRETKAKTTKKRKIDLSEWDWTKESLLVIKIIRLLESLPREEAKRVLHTAWEVYHDFAPLLWEPRPNQVKAKARKR